MGAQDDLGIRQPLAYRAYDLLRNIHAIFKYRSLNDYRDILRTKIDRHLSRFSQKSNMRCTASVRDSLLVSMLNSGAKGAS
ncbi:hypothetical protein D3C77_501410 [compost metagenome]